MLRELKIRNIALIEEISIAFGPGLNALTGETGAGKSIVIDSVTLLLGGRASKELIRTGEERAYVEGVFTLSDCPQAREWLKQNELEQDGDEVVLAREISRSGRSVCRVEGVMVALADYRGLSSMLMDIHGQHEHQSLMDERQHLKWLDAFGPEKHLELLRDTSDAYGRWQKTDRELQDLLKEIKDQADRMDILRYQKKELEKAHLVAGEEDELNRERALFRNASRIDENLRGAYQELYDNGSLPSAAESLRQASAHLERISDFDPDFARLSERLSNLYYEAEDLGLTLRAKLDSLQFDESRVNEVETRLDLIHRLSRKYGATTEEMLGRLDEIRGTIERLENAEDRTEDLRRRSESLHGDYLKAADLLNDSRRALARAFEKRMEKQLSELNMKGTRFRAELVRGEETAAGYDRCSFKIAPNLGEDFQPLAQTASGGELSRIMLAIKAIAGEKSLIPSMVFDEIDTGISGRTAQVVAEKMADIARYRQVLCVTHLPQIAAIADDQYLIEKNFNGERTVTGVTRLDRDGRVQELSRMLGGAGGQSKSAVEHARALLDQARARA